MADNVAITAGTGTAIHADEYTHATLGSGKTQLVKLVDGTLDSSTAIAAGGGTEDGALRVTIASDSTGVVSIDDNGSAITVDGTVTANLSATDNAVLDAIESDTTAILADTTTIAGDTTSIDAKIPALGQALAAASVPVVLPAAQITTLTPPAAITGFATSAKQDTIIGHIDGVETSLSSIDGKITAVNTGAVVVSSSALPTGAATAAKQPALGTAGTASADVITVQGIASMTALKVDGSAVTQPVSGTVAVTNSDITSIKTAVETIDNAISGSEMQVDVVAALPAGTNTIGAVKSVPSDIDINGSNANHADKYYTNAGAVTDGIIWSPAAGKRWHVLTLYINVSAAATVTLEDDLAGGDVVRWKGELAANSGVVLKYDKEHPFSSGEDAADLLVTTSAGNVYIQAVGYEV